MVEILLAFIGGVGVLILGLIKYIWNARVKMWERAQSRQEDFNTGISAQFKSIDYTIGLLVMELKLLEQKVLTDESKLNGLKTAFHKFRDQK